MKLAIALCTLFFLIGCSGKGTKPESKENAATAKSESKTAAPQQPDHRAAPPATTSDRVACKSAGDSRLIEIVEKKPGCGVHYTKQNESSEVASAEHDLQHCTEVFQRIRGRLEAAGFQCE